MDCIAMPKDVHGYNVSDITGIYIVGVWEVLGKVFGKCVRVYIMFDLSDSILEMVIHSFFEVLLCIAYVVLATTFTCCFVDYYRLSAVIFENTHVICFVSFLAIAFELGKITGFNVSSYFAGKVTLKYFVHIWEFMVGHTKF